MSSFSKENEESAIMDGCGKNASNADSWVLFCKAEHTLY